MSADEDTELRDLVAQTLETNGVLGKIRVFKTIQNIESYWWIRLHDAHIFRTPFYLNFKTLLMTLLHP